MRRKSMTAASRRAAPRRASAAEIIGLLSNQPGEIFRALNVRPSDANLSFPTDGKGARVRASIRPAAAAEVPSKIVLEIEDAVLEIPVEVRQDFEEFQPLRGE